MKRDTERRWYLTALAAVYFVLCLAGCLYYLSLQFRANAGTVPVVQQALCAGSAITAGVYFFRARAGHLALTALTVLTLLAIGVSDAEATAFHLCVLLLLLIPFVRKRNQRPAVSKAFPS